MELGLKDKVAAITGGSIGIGLAVAEGLAREGVHLALCARNEERVVEVANSIADKYGVKAIGVRADVCNPDDIGHFVALIEETFNGADILINNAGTGTNETILDAPDEKWQHFWDLHVMASVRLSRSLTPAMRRRGGGVILNNASICATQPIFYEPIYNVTKAALAMLSKCMAHEFMKYNIRVNTINPGLILTEGWEIWARQNSQGTGLTWEQYLDKIAADNTPIGRFATTAELADFFVFMCSPRASYCVGSSYYVDGGWLKVVN
ncbi:MAG: SDR family oxidoreductase [Chloroflexi bacterium]|nr:SDR family oxidoreductase [Chloroflexota bacterium]